MAEDKQQQDGQKTLVAFIVGLLIGGILVWAFSGPSATAPSENKKDDGKEEAKTSEDTTKDDAVKTEDKSGTPTPKLEVGDGKVVVNDQPASDSITLDTATYPVAEGWIGVREYNDGNLGSILGVVRFSESQGLVPKEIVLQRSTSAGKTYAVVIYTEDGDFKFNLATDAQIDSIFDTFVAK